MILPSMVLSSSARDGFLPPGAPGWLGQDRIIESTIMGLQTPRGYVVPTRQRALTRPGANLRVFDSVVDFIHRNLEAENARDVPEEERRRHSRR